MAFASNNLTYNKLLSLSFVGIFQKAYLAVANNENITKIELLEFYSGDIFNQLRRREKIRKRLHIICHLYHFYLQKAGENNEIIKQQMITQETQAVQIKVSTFQKAKSLMFNASKAVIEFVFKELESTQNLINQARLYLANLEIWENFKELGPNGFIVKVKELYQSRGGIWTPTVEFCTENFYKVAQKCKSGLKAVAECLLKGKNKIHEHIFESWEFLRQQESVNGTFENFLKALQVKLQVLQDKVKVFKLEDYIPQIKVFYSVAVTHQLKQLINYACQQLKAIKGKTYETFEDFKFFLYVTVDFMSLIGLRLLDIKNIQNVKNFIINVYQQVQAHLQKQYTDLDLKIKELIEKVKQSELPQNIQEKVVLFLTWCKKEDAKQKLEEWWDQLDQDEDGIVRIKDLVESIAHLVLLIFNKIPSNKDIFSLISQLKHSFASQIFQAQQNEDQEETEQDQSQLQRQDQEEQIVNRSQNQSEQNQQDPMNESLSIDGGMQGSEEEEEIGKSSGQKIEEKKSQAQEQ